MASPCVGSGHSECSEASFFADRATSYHHSRDFEYHRAQLGATCQKTVCSESHPTGVMTTLRTGNGFRNMAFTTSIAAIDEDANEWDTLKPTLTAIEDKESVNLKTTGFAMVESLYKMVCRNTEVTEPTASAVKFEKQNSRPMKIEQAYVGDDGKLYTAQAHPDIMAPQKKVGPLEDDMMLQKGDSVVTTQMWPRVPANQDPPDSETAKLEETEDSVGAHSSAGEGSDSDFQTDKKAIQPSGGRRR
jgi:pyruvate,water dikinase